MTILINNTEGFLLYQDKIIPLSETSASNTRNKLKGKYRVLNDRGFAVLDSNNKIVKILPNSHAQHFYPLSIEDYATVIYNHIKFSKPLPILSIDSHDTSVCDFRCQDCLSVKSRGVFKEAKKFIGTLNLDIYKKILSNIINYSKSLGRSFVRFEQSGEGNPDLYPARAEIVKFAAELGMKTVYITSGSKLDKITIDSLVENAHYIRLSFPGINSRSYELYSRQQNFTFEDALNRLEELVTLRESKGRGDELLIGARTTLRPEHDNEYVRFAKKIKELSVDTFQIVKILTPEGVDKKEHPISDLAHQQLEKILKIEDSTFNVSIPYRLDYMYYERNIEDRSDFPATCYSSLVQPVLIGNHLFVCTQDDKIIRPTYEYGTFQKKETPQDLIYSKKGTEIRKAIPNSCTTCCNIFDNLFMFEIEKLTRQYESLKFFSIVEDEDG